MFIVSLRDSEFGVHGAVVLLTQQDRKIVVGDVKRGKTTTK